MDKLSDLVAWAEKLSPEVVADFSPVHIKNVLVGLMDIVAALDAERNRLLTINLGMREPLELLRKDIAWCNFSGNYVRTLLDQIDLIRESLKGPAP